MSNLVNVQKHKDTLDKITIETLKYKVNFYLEMGLDIIKTDIVFGGWTESVCFEAGNQILMLRSDISHPNKVNEMILKPEDIEWLSQQQQPIQWLVTFICLPSNEKNIARLTANSYGEASDKASKIVKEMNKKWKDTNISYHFEGDVQPFLAIPSWDK